MATAMYTDCGTTGKCSQLRISRKSMTIIAMVLAALSVAVVIGGTDVSSAESETATGGTTGDCYWSVSDGVLTIGKQSDMGWMADYGSPEDVPWGNDITSVIIEEGVGKIGNYSFYGCTKLRSLAVPDSVTILGSYVCCGCLSLSEISISDSVFYIGEHAFEECTSLESIDLPARTGILGGRAFYGCTGLKNFNVPENSLLMNIGVEVFRGCTSIESMSLPNVYNVSESAFRGCTSLVSITLSEGASLIGDYAFCGCYNLAVFPGLGKLGNIGNHAFDGCTSLPSRITFDNLEMVGNGAFLNCTSLTSISLPSTLKSLGNSAFSGCVNLTEFTFDARSCADMEDGCDAFLSAGSSGTGINFVFGDDVGTIPANLFSVSDASKIPKIVHMTIGFSITAIGDSTFSDLSELESVQVSGNLARIGNSAFNGCVSLADFAIPYSVTYIGKLAFNDCSSLTSVKITPNVTYIGSFAFKGCTHLDRLEFYADADDLVGYAIQRFYEAGIDGDGIDVVFGNDVTTIPDCLFYVADSGHSPKLRSVTFGKSLNEVGQYAFNGVTGLETIVLPASVTVIRESAFSNMADLKVIRIPSALKSMGFNTFSGCSSLVSADLPDIGAVPANTFNGCSSLESITIPSTASYIASNAFRGCSSLKSLVIPDGCTSLSENAFYGCSGLQTIVIGKGIVSIPYRAFAYCQSLNDLTLGDNVETIDREAFLGCISLPSLKLGDSVRSLAFGAFKDCAGLTSVTFGKSVTTLGEQVFGGCSGLRSVSIPDTVTALGTSCFGGTSLVEVSISRNMADMDMAFSGCTTLTSIQVEEGNPTYYSVDGVLFKKYDDVVKLLQFPQAKQQISYSVPADVEIIGYSAFRGCLLEEVTFHSSLEINDNAFRDCANLKAIDLSTCTRYGSNLFMSCTSLTSVVLSDNVRGLSTNMFNGCTSLSHVVFSKNTTVIGDSAFAGCTSLTEVELPDRVYDLGSSAFAGCTSLTKVRFSSDLLYYRISPFGDCRFYQVVDGNAVETDSVKDLKGKVFQIASAGRFVQEHSHSAGEAVDENIVESTCTVAGSCDSVSYCTICGAEMSRDHVERPLADHVAVIDEAVEPTCTTPGLTTGTHCSVCNNVIVAQTVVAALGHSKGTHHETVGATCTESGCREYWDCSRCGSAIGNDLQTVYDLSVGAFGHDIAKVVPRPPTCTTSGYGEYYLCIRCRAAFLDSACTMPTTAGEQAIAALGHSKGTHHEATASCTEDGCIEYWDCANGCGSKLSDDLHVLGNVNIKATGHHIIRINAKIPTCTTAGCLEFYICNNCHQCYSDAAGTDPVNMQEQAIAALGHHLSTVEARPATCTEPGNNQYSVCDRCGSVFSATGVSAETTVEAQVIPALGHLKGTHHEATAGCTEDGCIEYWDCANGCGAKLADDLSTLDVVDIAATGHQLVRVDPKLPTCTQSGNKGYYACANCHQYFDDAEANEKTTVEAQVLAALGHHMVKTDAASATCTQSGNNAYFSCERCLAVFTDEAGSVVTTAEDQTIPALGHSKGAHHEATASCTESGSIEYWDCANGCGSKLSEDISVLEIVDIAATGHAMLKIGAVLPTCIQSGNHEYYRCNVCKQCFTDAAGTITTPPDDQIIPALEHSMAETPSKRPTCTEDGNSLYYTCGRCHSVFADEVGIFETTVESITIPALGHSKGTHHVATATCTEAGCMEYWDCANGCGAKLAKDLSVVDVVDISATGHQIVKVDPVMPTCTDFGYTGYYMCSNCHRCFADAEGTEPISLGEYVLVPLGHQLTLIEARPASCIEAGNNLYYACERCHSAFFDAAGSRETSVEAQTVAALGHSKGTHHDATATCTEAGCMEYWDCANGCGSKIDEDLCVIDVVDISATGHQLGKVEARLPACTHTGNNEYYVCESCHQCFADAGANVKTSPASQIVAALGHHTVKTKAVSATCTQAGNNEYYTCDRCQSVFEDEAGTVVTTAEKQIIAAFGHSKGTHHDATATCTEAGCIEYWDCANGCGSKIDDDLRVLDTVDISAPGHQIVRVDARLPSCTDDGNREYYLCTQCNRCFTDAEGTSATTAVEQTIGAMGHKEVSVSGKTPTCTEQGLTDGTVCSICGEVMTAQVPLSAFGHAIIHDEAVPATKAHEGMTAGAHCVVCGEVLLKQNILPKIPQDAVSTSINAYDGNAYIEDSYIPVLINDGLKLEIKDDTHRVELPTDVLSSIIDGKQGLVNLKMADVELSSLSEGQQEAARGALLVISLNMSVGSSMIHELGGIATVSVDFTLSAGQDVSKLYVAYLKDDGSVEIMDCSYADGRLTFQTDHFSVFAVMGGSSDAGDYNILPDILAFIVFAVISVIVVLGVTVAQRKQ